MTTLRTPWRAVTAMFILNGALLGIWAARIPSVKEIHGLEPRTLGLLLLLLAFGALVSFPLTGRAVDRYGAARMTRGIAVPYTLSLILIALAPSLPVLAVTLFIFGATHGAMDVAMNTWAGEVERRLGRPVMSSFHAMFSLGLGLGAATMLVAVRLEAGMLVHALVCGIALALLTLWFARITEPPVQAQSAKGPVFQLPRGALFLVGLIAFCTSLGEGANIDWSAVYLTEVTQADKGRAALGLWAFSTTMVAMRLAGDRVILALGPVNAARLAGTTAVIGALTLILAPGYTLALVGFGLMGIGYAIVMPLAFSRAANDPEMSPGAAVAAVATLGYGGLLLGPPIIGFLAQAIGLQNAFGLLAGLAALVVALAGALRRP